MHENCNATANIQYAVLLNNDDVGYLCSPKLLAGMITGTHWAEQGNAAHVLLGPCRTRGAQSLQLILAKP